MNEYDSSKRGMNFLPVIINSILSGVFLFLYFFHGYLVHIILKKMIKNYYQI